jgi:hypothetical protein
MAPIHTNQLSLCNRLQIHRRYTRTTTIPSSLDRQGHSTILPSPSITPTRFYLISTLERVTKTTRRRRGTQPLTFKVSNTSLRSLTININNSRYRAIPLRIPSHTNTTPVLPLLITLMVRAMAPEMTLIGPRIRCGRVPATFMDLLSRREVRYHLLEQCWQAPRTLNLRAQVGSCGSYSVVREQGTNLVGPF